MALRRILKFPAAELKQNAAPVAAIDGRINELLGDMADTMYAAPGVGLAAPQLGIAERLITLDVNHDAPGTNLLKLINPEIVERDGSVMWEEACLSVVDFAAEVRRSARVLVRAWTLDQRQIEIEAEDLLAVALQHEIDHLDGKLFIDRLSPLKRESYKRKLKKMMREGVDLDSLPSRPNDPDDRQDAEDAI